MVAEANYGGRVTDNQDRRAIVCILRTFYTPLVLKDDYCFSVSGIYHCPPASADLDETMTHIKNFPLNTTPEVFWLHNNAKLTAAINEGMYILKTCTGLMASFGGGAVADDDDDGGKQKTPEEIYSEISGDIAQRTPEPFDIGRVILAYPVLYEQCLNVVLHMELGKFNRLTKAIKSTCSNLGKAVKGLVVFSPELEAVSIGCLTNVTPGPWMKASYPSLKPLGSYFDDFCGRIKFMRKWVDEGIPFMFWFSAYFFQQAFITGALQNFARKDKIPIDNLTWNYEVMKRSFVPSEYPEKGAYINGLFMAGARWDDDNMVVEDSYPKVLWDEMSAIWMKPVDKSKDASSPNTCYQCPVYKTSERKGVLSTSGHSSNFILWLEIPAHIPESVRDKAAGTSFEDFWTKRGVALISQTDD
jgi:dynein heavy chain